MPAGSAAESPRPASFRWLAFGAQALLSILIALVLYYGLIAHWFPGHLFEAEGGKLALLLIGGVDLVLGPGLTLIAASPGKANALVRQDLITTSLLRTLALAVGIWLCWDNRPAAVIWLDGAFYSMPWSALDDEPAARAALAGHLRAGPQYISIDLPDDPKERAPLYAAALARNSSLLFDAERYRPFDASLPSLQEANHRYLMRLDDGRRQAIKAQGVDIVAITKKHWLLLPIVARYRTYHLLVAAESGTIIRAVNVRPNLPIKYRR